MSAVWVTSLMFTSHSDSLLAYVVWLWQGSIPLLAVSHQQEHQHVPLESIFDRHSMKIRIAKVSHVIGLQIF